MTAATAARSLARVSQAKLRTQPLYLQSAYLSLLMAEAAAMWLRKQRIANPRACM